MTNIDINAINNEDLREAVRTMYIAMIRKPLIIELEDARATVQQMWDDVIEPTWNEELFEYQILNAEPNGKELLKKLNACMDVIDFFNNYINKFMV